MTASQNMTLFHIADDVLELEDNDGRRSSIWSTYLIQPGYSMAFINEYHIGEMHFVLVLRGGSRGYREYLMIRSDFSKRVCMDLKKLLENININPLMYFYSILFPCANNYEDLSLQIQKNTILFNFHKFTALMYHLAVFLKYYTVFGEDEPRGF